MPGAVERSNTSGSTSLHNSSNLKKLASENEWVSPFRTGGSRKSLREQLTQQNSISNIKVPSKFTSHGVLQEAENEKGKLEGATKARKSTEDNLEERNREEEGHDANETVEENKSLEKETIIGEKETEKVEPKSKEREDSQKVKEEDSQKVKKEDSQKAKKEDSQKVKEEESQKVKEEESQKVKKEDSQKAKKEDSQKVKKEDSQEVKKEDVEIKGDNESERPLSEEEKKHLDKEEAGEKVGTKKGEADGEEPIDIVEQPLNPKVEAVNLPNQETIENLKDKPKMLQHFQQLNASAYESAFNNLNDPNRIIDVGAGLKMTRQSLLDMAAKRVAPVLSNLEEEVAKSRKEDDIKREKQYGAKVSSHEKKLLGSFEKYKKKVSKQKNKYDVDHSGKLNDLEKKKQTADSDAVAFEGEIKDEIEEANKNYETRKEEASNKHEVDKETLLRNHNELVTLKKKELEETIASSEKTSEEIKQLEEAGESLDKSNTELTAKINKTKPQLDEISPELEELKNKTFNEREMVDRYNTTKAELNSKITESQEKLNQKKEKHSTLVEEIKNLKKNLSVYATKSAYLQSVIDEHPKRLADARNKSTAWETERQGIANDVAKEDERKRLTAIAQNKREKELANAVHTAPEISEFKAPKESQRENEIANLNKGVDDSSAKYSVKRKPSISKSVERSAPQTKKPESEKPAHKTKKSAEGEKTRRKSLISSPFKKHDKSQEKPSVSATKDKDSEYDDISLYEEVSEEEFSKHKNNPDYVELTGDEIKRRNRKYKNTHILPF